jgi:hypothetical protein
MRLGRLRLHFIVSPTLPAPHNQAIHFVVVCDHEQGAALTAKILIGVRSHSDRGRCRGNVANARRSNDPELEGAPLPLHGDHSTPSLAHKWGPGWRSSFGRGSVGTIAARRIPQGIANNALAVLHDVHFESKAHPTASEFQQGKSVLGVR